MHLKTSCGRSRTQPPHKTENKKSWSGGHDIKRTFSSTFGVGILFLRVPTPCPSLQFCRFFLVIPGGYHGKARRLLLSGTFSISKIFHPLTMPTLFSEISLFAASNFMRPLSFKVSVTLHKKFLCFSNNIGPTIWPNTSLLSITKFNCWTSRLTTVHPKNTKTKLSK